MNGLKTALSLLTLGGVLSFSAAASAHMGSTKSVELVRDGARVTADVRVNTTDAALALGLGTTLDPSALKRHGALVGGWLSRGLVVSSDAGPCSHRFGSPERVVTDGVDQVRVHIDYACGSTQGLALRDDTIFDDDPDHEVFVSLRTAEGDVAHVLRAEQRSVDLAAAPAASQTVATFVGEGVRHLLLGYDHLLFLLSLILVAGLATRRDGRRVALTDIGLLVTAFTLGHSVSLVSAAVGWVALPARWVEAAIAGSIVLVALLNLARPEPPTRRSRRVRISIAGGFGLVHGFGFSSVLAEVGLPPMHRVLALASFNVGIELGQIACVLVALLPLALWARRPSYRRYAVQGGSFAIAACGCVWLVERTLAL